MQLLIIFSVSTTKTADKIKKKQIRNRINFSRKHNIIINNNILSNNEIFLATKNERRLTCLEKRRIYKEDFIFLCKKRNEIKKYINHVRYIK